MNCPKCGGKGRKEKYIKEGDSTYKQFYCFKCRELYHTVETPCTKEEFLIRQRKKQNEQYRKRCMRKWQEV